MQPIWLISFLITGCMAFAGPAIATPSPPYDTKSRVPIEELAPHTKKASKKLIESLLVGRRVSYRYEKGVRATGGSRVDWFNSDGSFESTHEYIIGPDYIGQYAIFEGSICIYSIINLRFPFHRCRAVLVDEYGNIWIQMPYLGSVDFVIPSISK